MKLQMTLFSLLLLIIGFFTIGNSEDIFLAELYKAITILVCLNLLRIPSQSLTIKK